MILAIPVKFRVYFIEKDRVSEHTIQVRSPCVCPERGHGERQAVWEQRSPAASISSCWVTVVWSISPVLVVGVEAHVHTIY